MKTATVRQLRHGFSSVLVWVEDGEPAEISKRATVICANFAATASEAGVRQEVP